VENKRNSGDVALGISQGKVKSLKVTLGFPQLSPQQIFSQLGQKTHLIWKKLCNYKKVILLTHISTTVITTNFKYKTFSWRVHPLNLQVAGAKTI
jgi:hypothetical protein